MGGGLKLGVDDVSFFMILNPETSLHEPLLDFDIYLPRTLPALDVSI